MTPRPGEGQQDQGQEPAGGRDETAAIIAALDVAELSDTEGNTVGRVKKVKLADKLAALDKIGRHLGIWNDKITLKGDAENPLVLLVQQLQGSAIRPVGIVPEELPAPY